MYRWNYIFISPIFFSGTVSDSPLIDKFLPYTQGFQSGPVPGTFTRLRSCIVPAEITEPPKICGGNDHTYITGDYTKLCLNIICNQSFFYFEMMSALFRSEFYTRMKRYNIFHKKLMITSIAEFSHSNRTTASRPSWWDIPCFKNNFTLES
jgi:hypothetical protein